MNAFALNHRVAPGMTLGAFFDLAVSLGIDTVEIRNDLPGVALSDGTPPASVKAEAAARGLRIASINALYPFNVWTEERARDAQALIAYAQACGAEGIVLCPLNDATDRATSSERQASAREALAGLAPLLRAAGIKGLVEPLGFPESSLRLKRDAVAAIDAVESADVFKLVHDTFHHHVAGEAEMFPERTGLVHVSGVVDPELPAERMRDAHRVLVDEADRLDNLGQLRRLVAGGYAGPVSFEPFADSVSASPDIATALAESLRHLAPALGGARA